jgi:hypothetical protein
MLSPMSSERLRFFERTSLPAGYMVLTLVLVILCVALIAVLSWAGYLLFGRLPWVSWALWAVAALCVPVAAYLLVCLVSKNTLAVTDRAVYVRVHPIGVNRRLDFAEIERVDPQEFKLPQLNRGLGSELFLYSVALQGVRLTPRSGRPIILASDQRDDLLAAILDGVEPGWRTAARAPRD